MNIVNFFSYQVERAKTTVSFYIPEMDAYLLKEFLDTEYVSLLSFVWKHPELNITILIKDGFVTIIPGI